MIIPSNPRDVSWLGANMRDEDRAEIMCQMPPEAMGSDAALACHIVSPEDLRFIALDKGEPVAAWGAVPMTHCVWQGWGFGTKRVWRAVPAMRRHIVNVMTPALIARGCRRFEIRVLKGHGLAHLLTKSLGGKYRCDLPDSGHSGEVLELWEWTTGNPPHVF
jgi:hypothetical protein